MIAFKSLNEDNVQVGQVVMAEARINGRLVGVIVGTVIKVEDYGTEEKLVSIG